MVAGLVAVLVILGYALSRGDGPQAAAQEDLGYRYSAKFLCGTISGGDGPLSDGTYATAVNVHNLQDYEVGIFKKAVIALVEPDVGTPSAHQELDVPSDAAFEIDCPDILTFFDETPSGFIKGFVVVDSPVELDVWGVYTSTHSAGGTTAGTGIAEDIEVVPFTRQPFPPVTCVDHDGDTSCADPVNDTDDDGCTAAEEALLGPNFSDAVWYDVFDVKAPVKADAVGVNKKRNGLVDIADALSVLFYFAANDNAGINGNGVDYDTVKGVDLDGDSTNDVTPLHAEIEEGLIFDRTPGPGLTAGPPNGFIDIADALVALKQFGLMNGLPGAACSTP